MSFIGDTLYRIDSNTMVLGLFFIIFYILINLPLKRVFKRERASSTILSLCVSLLAVYGINRMNWDLSRLFFSLGFSENVLYAIVPWILLGLVVLASFSKDVLTGKRKFRLYRFFMILGALLIFLSFFAYEKAVLLIAGIILIILGIFFWFRRKKKENLNPQDNNKKDNRQVDNKQGLNILIEEAKNFKSWALRTNNPKFYGGWAYFISYLSKKRGYPRGEWAICQKLGITKNDFVRIFNRYGKV